MACSGWKVYSGLYYLCSSFRPNHQSLCFDMLFVFSHSNLESLTHKPRHTQANASQCVQRNSFTPTPFKCSPSQSGLASAFQLTFFPLQMTASTWEMSGSLCQRCLASSNICEVLSSSLQLRRAVSQESRLLTRNTAKTA